MTASLKLLHLSEFQFDRRSAAEDRHSYLHARAALVDFLDDTVEGSEWSIRHAHLLSDFERNRGLRPLDAFLHLVQDAIGLRVRNRHRFLFAPEKAGDLRRVLDEVIDLVSEIHLHQHVTLEELPLRLDLAAASCLGDLFLRYQDFTNMF